MAPQTKNEISTHAHEVSVWTILSILLNEGAPHLGVTNGNIQTDLVTLTFKQGEQLEDFHGKSIRMKQ